MRLVALLLLSLSAIVAVVAALDATATAGTAPPPLLNRVYVSPFGDDSPGNGGFVDSPVRTLSYAHTIVTDDGTGVIYMLPGVYTGYENIISFTKYVTVTAHYTVKSPRQCYFDAQRNSNGPYFHVPTSTATTAGKTFTFSGLGFANSAYSGSLYATGFIAINNNSGNVTISNCEFWNNANSVSVRSGSALHVQNTNFNGGTAIVVPGGSTPTGTSVSIDLQNANLYSGYYLVDISNGPTSLTGSKLLATQSVGLLNVDEQDWGSWNVNLSDVTARNCTQGIVLTGGNYYSGRVRLIRPNFLSNGGTGNTLAKSGGGLYVGPNVRVDISDSLFQDNTANNGGAFYCSGDATINMQTADFESNTATNNGAVGYCAPSCAFNALDVTQNGNSAPSNTYPCPGL